MSTMRFHAFTWKCGAHNLVLPNRVSCPECARDARAKLHYRGVAHAPRRVIDEVREMARLVEEKQRQADCAAIRPNVAALLLFLERLTHCERSAHERRKRGLRKKAKTVNFTMMKNTGEQPIRLGFTEARVTAAPGLLGYAAVDERATQRLRSYEQQFHVYNKLGPTLSRLADEMELYMRTSSAEVYEKQQRLERGLDKMIELNPSLRLSAIHDEFMWLVNIAVARYRKENPGSKPFGTTVRNNVTYRFVTAYLRGERR